MKKVNLLLLIGFSLLTGCATTTEILPGICYDEEELSHLCVIEPEVKECIHKGECKYA